MATGIPRIRLDSLHSALAEGRLVITANNRTRDAVLLAWSDEQEPDAWLQPRVEAIDLWLQQLWEELAASGLAPYCDYRLLNPVQEQLLWTQIIEDERDALPLINTQATARLASQAYQLITQWQVDEAALHSYDGLLDIATFLRWKDRFRKRCHDLSAVSLADLVKQLLAAIAARDISVATGAILLNFEQPPPLYQQLLNCLVDEHGATMVYSNSSNNDPTAQLLQLPVSDRREETEACVSWVLAQQRHNPGAHIAIVSRRHLERATELEKVFYALSPGQMPPGHRFFNCYQSRFDPDRNEALRAALLLLNCNRELIGTADACRLLRADNIRAGVDSEARILLEQHLRRYKESVLRSSELRRLAAHTGKEFHCPGLASLFSLFDHGRRQRGRREPSAWADLFQQQLDAADWPTRAESAAQRQVIKIWKAALANLRALAPQYPSMDLEQALRTIQLLCGMITTTDRFDAAVQVTLASPEECFGLQFDAIWVLDTDDKQWPEAARPNPLLPYSLQYEARMPRSSADWQHQEARRQFQGLKDATREQLLFSYCETEEEQQLRPSPLLHGLTVAQLASADLPAISLDMTTITDCQNLPLAPGESIKGGTSLLSDQSQCPFRSFARHRLHTEALREFSSGPDSADRGSMLHTALKVVWDQLQGSDALQRLSEADLEQLLQHACTVATDELRGKYPETVTPVYSDLEQIRLRRLLVAQLELDRQRPPFTTPYREHELTWHGPGFELNLKADRIDRLANGSYFLVDYKSGRSAINTRHWQGERPEDMQLALYHSSMVAATITPVAGAAMLQLHAEQQQYYGAIDTDEAGWLKPVRPREDWQALAAAWPQNVTRLAGEFSDGVNRVEPLDPVRTCTYCDFHSLCRIQENSAVFEAESPEGSPQDD